jgi:nucleotide-binding universal stress UspA family protein
MSKILVPTDGSVQAQKAIDFACDLAWEYNAEVYIAHVAFKTKVPEYVVEFVKTERIEGSPERVYMDALGKDIIERAEDQVRGAGVEEFSVGGHARRTLGRDHPFCQR